MRRFALYSDIHGNLPALEAVLADMDAAGVDERYCLGDLVGYGPEPSAVIARVRATGDAVVLGNYDDGVGERRGSCGCAYTSAGDKTDGEAGYQWTDEALGDDERRYLAGLPRQIAFEAEGVRVVLVHASPRRLNQYLFPDRLAWNLAKLAKLAEADLICHGHVHLPFHRAVPLEGGGVAHFVSDGAVGRPRDGDPRACWTEVVIGTADEVSPYAGDDLAAGDLRRLPDAEADAAARMSNASGPCVAARHHRVEYDVEAVASAILRAGLPPRFAEALRHG